jgi:PAS domain S-box-containing protein
MLGYDSMEEFMHCPVADLYQDPADRATLVREASAAGYIRRKELRLKKKDGTLLWATCTATVFRDPEGHILWMDGVVEDITALKQAEKALRDSEQKHRTLVHALAEGIWVMDERDITTLVNPHMAAMLGYTEQEMVGRPVFDFMDEQGAAICKRNIEARKQGIAETHEFELIDKKGRRHYVVMGTAPLTNSKGEYAGAIASVRDETEMKRTKEEREFLATTLLEVQEQERQAISATLHDDLGQVLTLAKMELSSLPSGSYPSAGIEKTMARLDEALASVRRMAVSLRPPLLDDIGLKAAIESLVEDMSDSSGIRVSLSVEGVCPALGKKAETCIFRVLQEALTNVVRHSGAAHAEVTLRAIGPECRIEVADDGTGFNTLDYAKGLGLLGMRERLEHLGGTLHVTSTPAQGTRVIAVVPHAASLDKDPDHD